MWWVFFVATGFMVFAVVTVSVLLVQDRRRRASTPLHSAGVSGDVRAIRESVQRGDDIDSLDGLERTPLVCAVQCGKHEAVRLLLELGANVNGCSTGSSSNNNSSNNDGRTQRRSKVPPLTQAVVHRDLRLVHELIHRGGACVHGGVFRGWESPATRLIMRSRLGATPKRRKGHQQKQAPPQRPADGEMLELLCARGAFVAPWMLKRGVFCAQGPDEYLLLNPVIRVALKYIKGKFRRCDTESALRELQFWWYTKDEATLREYPEVVTAVELMEQSVLDSPLVPSLTNLCIQRIWAAQDPNMQYDLLPSELRRLFPAF